jgi:hypothetical protein
MVTKPNSLPARIGSNHPELRSLAAENQVKHGFRKLLQNPYTRLSALYYEGYSGPARV